LSRPVDFLTPISTVPGFGEKRVLALKKSNINRVEDLLYYLPLRYIDKSKVVPIAELYLNSGNSCMVTGEVITARVERGNKTRFRVAIRDGSGVLELVWFSGVSYLQKILVTGCKISAFGVPKKFIKFQMVHPEIEIVNEGNFTQFPFEPRYPLTESMRSAKIGQKRLRDAIIWAFNNIRHFPRKIPDELENKIKLSGLKESLFYTHFPKKMDLISKYRERLIYEELYQIALNIRWTGREFSLPGRALNSNKLVNDFIKTLLFNLTKEQLNVLQILNNESCSKNRMHRLLQGDVGSGKTVTAFIASLPAVESGFQVAWLTPTAVLAHQSYSQIKKWLAPFNFEVRLLTGSTPIPEKREIKRALKIGKINFIVGTHALIQDSVGFSKLGMVVVDEQHRFGAEQRLALQKKDSSCDLLMMSATPIPQSLASTLYSDLELITIDSLPEGRIPIKSHIVPELKRDGMEKFIADRVINKKEKVFWVVPRIESTEDDFNELVDIEQIYKQLSTGVFKNSNISVLHGQMRSVEKEQVMEEFKSGESSIMLATTVIEVGVDIPDATVMVIENSERFGMAQLHQLRGRVGRSNLQSWAFFLMSNSVTEESINRVSKFIDAKDGFEIAELDLLIRGTGEIAGFKQSGFSELKFSNILERADQFKEIKADIEAIMSKN
jgi:ATP-dependent DNA helicase RecG